MRLLQMADPNNLVLAGRAGEEAFAGCVRCSLKLLATLPDEDAQKYARIAYYYYNTPATTCPSIIRTLPINDTSL